MGSPKRSWRRGHPLSLGALFPSSAKASSLYHRHPRRAWKQRSPELSHQPFAPGGENTSGELAVWDALLGAAGNADDGCVQKGKRDLVVATSQMGLNPLDICSEGFDQLRSCAAWDLGFPSHLETCSHLAVGCAEDACRCPCETRFLLSLLLLTKGSY